MRRPDPAGPNLGGLPFARAAPTGTAADAAESALLGAGPKPIPKRSAPRTQPRGADSLILGAEKPPLTR